MKCQNVDKKVSKFVNAANLFLHYLATKNRQTYLYFWFSINNCRPRQTDFIGWLHLDIRHSKLTFAETGDLDLIWRKIFNFIEILFETSAANRNYDFITCHTVFWRVLFWWFWILSQLIAHVRDIQTIWRQI